MAQVLKKVGRFEVSTWTDGWPLWIVIKDNDGSELRRLLPEDALDLQYALERLQVQIAPIVEKMARPKG